MPYFVFFWYLCHAFIVFISMIILHFCFTFIHSQCCHAEFHATLINNRYQKKFLALALDLKLNKTLHFFPFSFGFRVFICWIILSKEEEGQLSGPHIEIHLLPVVS